MTGKEVKKLRRKLGLNQKQLAKILGVSQPRISYIEKNGTTDAEVVDFLSQLTPIKRFCKKRGCSKEILVSNNQSHSITKYCEDHLSYSTKAYRKGYRTPQMVKRKKRSKMTQFKKFLEGPDDLKILRRRKRRYKRKN